MRWYYAFRDTRGERLLDRVALTWLTRGRRGGWIRNEYGLLVRTASPRPNPSR